MSIADKLEIMNTKIEQIDSKINENINIKLDELKELIMTLKATK